MHSQGNKMYQPDPFGSQVPHVRGDCAERMRSIAKYADFKDKTILDFGCAEGYFGFSALKLGAKSCIFIDIDDACLRVIDDRAIKNGLARKVYVYPSLSRDTFDIAFCLSLWSEPGVPSLKDFHKLTQVLFISTSGNGYEKNGKLLDEASNIFAEVIPVHSGYQGRTIYRCTRE